MKIATWNVNSIRSRLDRLLHWLATVEPDVVCLQELKVVDAQFPHDAIREAGYHAAVYGQKTYNGVAILSRREPTGIERGLDDATDDPQARLLAADLKGARVLSVYVPNGQSVGSEKYTYKIDWLRRLHRYLQDHLDPAAPAVLCGDFNVARDDLDVARPDRWAESVLCHREVRHRFDAILAWGLADVVRAHHPEGGVYSWWDYRMLAFPKNDGLRIDHVLATASMADRCTAAEIDRNERKGAKPSDHAPVVATFDI
jgi:exodeoxyribonuclease-3